MNKTQILKDIENQRYLNTEDAKVYYQMGRGLLDKTAKRFNAKIKVGRRTLYDKKKMDEALESLAREVK